MLSAYVILFYPGLPGVYYPHYIEEVQFSVNGSILMGVWTQDRGKGVDSGVGGRG